MGILLYDQLEKSCMAFKLKDGNIILIDKEDIKEIGRLIIIERLVDKSTIVLKEKSLGIEKANMLYNILKTEKDMKPEMRNRYLKQIGDFLMSDEKGYTDTKTNKEVDFKEAEDTTLVNIS